MENTTIDINRPDNVPEAAAAAAKPAGIFSTRIGRTTYVVGVHFSDKGRDSYDDRAKKLIRADLKAGNF